MARARWFVAGVGVAVLLMGGAAWASPHLFGSSGLLVACAKTSNGDLRLVAAASDCTRYERAVSWNVQGPAGQAGPRGFSGRTTSAGGYAYIKNGALVTARSRGVQSVKIRWTPPYLDPGCDTNPNDCNIPVGGKSNPNNYFPGRYVYCLVVSPTPVNAQATRVPESYPVARIGSTWATQYPNAIVYTDDVYGYSFALAVAAPGAAIFPSLRSFCPTGTNLIVLGNYTIKGTSEEHVGNTFSPTLEDLDNFYLSFS